MRYTKKPVTIDAMQYTNSPSSIFSWYEGLTGELCPWAIHAGCLEIPTLEGTMTARPTDWIIRGTKGEFYPCKDEVFKEVYETAAGDQPRAG